MRGDSQHVHTTALAFVPPRRGLRQREATAAVAVPVTMPMTAVRAPSPPAAAPPPRTVLIVPVLVGRLVTLCAILLLAIALLRASAPPTTPAARRRLAPWGRRVRRSGGSRANAPRGAPRAFIVARRKQLVESQKLGCQCNVAIEERAAVELPADLHTGRGATQVPIAHQGYR